MRRPRCHFLSQRRQFHPRWRRRQTAAKKEGGLQRDPRRHHYRSTQRVLIPFLPPPAPIHSAEYPTYVWPILYDSVPSFKLTTIPIGAPAVAVEGRGDTVRNFISDWGCRGIFSLFCRQVGKWKIRPPTGGFTSVEETTKWRSKGGGGAPSDQEQLIISG